MKSKRGAAFPVFLVIIEIVLAVLFSFGMFAFSERVADADLAEKEWITRDLATTASAISSSPGEVEYIYKEDIIDVTKITIDVGEQLISSPGFNRPYTLNKEGPKIIDTIENEVLVLRAGENE